MKKLLFIGALALSATACDPEIAQDAAPDNVGLAEFNPSASPAIVPSPNDLAIDSTTGIVNAPIDPKAPAAQQEFTRDYLNTLNGFPPTAIANTKVANLDPRSVNATTVKIIDLYKGTPLETPPQFPLIGYNPDTGYINIIPQDAKGVNAWPKGGRYAVALIGGDNGLKTLDGKNVIASATWAFASSEKSLVTCEDLTAPDCKPATELIPSVKTDPAERLADQTNSSLRLEQLRRAYAPLIGALVAQGVKREDIVLLWTFSIMNQPEATFDPSRGIVPFPNDLIRTPATATTPAHLSLPIPAGASDTVKQLYGGLNTLDGFSTTAPITSDNSDASGVLDVGSLDQTTLDAAVKFLKVSNTDKGTAPVVKVCLNCASSLKADGTTPQAPQQLQVVPQVPLDEATQYGVVMTTALKDTRGRRVAPAGAFALMRLAAPLVVNGKSQVNGIPDSIAAQLEPVRQAYKPFFDALDKAGIKRSQIALGWAFTTQSTTAVLNQLYALPTALQVPAAPNYLVDATPQVKGAMAASSLANDQIGFAFEGQMNLPFLLTGPGDTLNPAGARLDRAPFLVIIPKTAAPAAGYPVVVFGHGLTGNRTNVLGVANKLAGAGYAVVSMDAVYHGERATCVGAASVLGQTSDDAACANPTTQRCEKTVTSAAYGRCVARDDATRADCSAPKLGAIPGDVYCSQNSQGRCMADNKCEGGDFLRASAGQPPRISGWNLLNLSNLFATRDNFRHHVVDFAQLTRVLASPKVNEYLNAQGAGSIDGSRVDYLGQSLGGILGTMSAAVSPKVHHVALNVTGGGLADVLLTSPGFKAPRDAFLAGLAAQGIAQGTPTFDAFIGLARTILDPADPLNYGYQLKNSAAAPADREAFIQYIEGDLTIPNERTTALINSANRNGSTRTVATYLTKYADDVVTPAKKHGFLSDPTVSSDPATSLAIRDAAQTQVIGFLKTGTLPQ